MRHPISAEEGKVFARQSSGEKNPSDVCVCSALRRATRVVSQFYDLLLAPSGLRITQFIVLKAMHEVGEVAQCDFARDHGIAVETLSRRFGALRRRGLVEMHRGPHHGERIYRLTPSGEVVFANALPYWERAQQRLSLALGEDDWRALLQICDRVCLATHQAEQFRTKNQVPLDTQQAFPGGITADCR